MVLRLAIVAVCAGAVVLLGARLRDHDRCEAARTAMVGALFRQREPAGGLQGQGRRLRDACRDAEVLAFVSTVATAAERGRLAIALAREATRREPDAFSGWVALSQALRGGDPAGAGRALARARALNPRLIPPPS